MKPVSKEYTTWSGMKRRCYNPKNPKYPIYGGRGIIVCDRWLNSFENFFSDMGQKPTPQHSIDRINNDGNYEPNNCRWATKEEQQNNKSNNIKFPFNGLNLNIRDWARILDVAPGLLMNRLRRGWNIYDAFTKPPVPPKIICQPTRFLTFKGESRHLSEWSRITGIDRTTIRTRIDKYGWCVEDALTIPRYTKRGHRRKPLVNNNHQ